MSIRPGDEKTPNEMPEAGPVMETITPKPRDLGDNFMVRRALPTIEKRMIGPFVFWDEFGPVQFEAGRGMDVRPHPHINLATVTYLFEGEIFHRDTLGSAQAIKPGDVNWMNAGRGIAHSERTAPELRAELPFIDGEGKRVRVIAGKLFGAQSPVQTYSEMFYADVQLDAGASLPLDTDHEERGVYIVSGVIEVGGETHEAGRLLYFRPGAPVTIRAQTPARFMALGGAVLGPRHVWWNFVSSRKERIEQAKEDWKAGRFGTIPGDDKEFIPLPEH
jgi:hypothetical protein